MGVSRNFGFLAAHAPDLEELAACSEQLCFVDANASLFRLRQFAETMATRVARHSSCHWVFREDFFSRLNRLQDAGLLNADVARLFHEIRRTGNNAVHYRTGSPREALYHLKLARSLAVWYHRVFARDRSFSPPPFLPPDPGDHEQKLDDAARRELEHLRQRVADLEKHLKRARENSRKHREARKRAEKLAQRAWDDLQAAARLMEQSGNEDVSLLLSRHLPEPEGREAKHLAELTQNLRRRCTEAAELMSRSLDADDLRFLVDKELRAAGWEADGLLQTWQAGVRPQAGKARAIARWPTYEGPAGYILFHGKMPLAGVALEPGDVDLAQTLRRAAAYSRDYVFGPEEKPPPGGPWQGYRLPFAAAANGRVFAHRRTTRCGIWLRDLRLAGTQSGTTNPAKSGSDEGLATWPRAQQLARRAGF